jgi:hypothetical protein
MEDKTIEALFTWDFSNKSMEFALVLATKSKVHLS